MIDVKNLKKSFGDVHVLKGITTHVNKGECICIIGPSGSGKSTFLRCLNLLEKPEEGEITVNGQQLLDPKLDVDKFRENVGMVFQHFNLFPNMTVLKNITLAPVRLGKWNAAEADQKARVWESSRGKDEVVSFQSIVGFLWKNSALKKRGNSRGGEALGVAKPVSPPHTPPHPLPRLSKPPAKPGA